MQEITPLIEKYSKTTTDLLSRDCQYEVNASHFGGKPFATAESDWPICKRCKYGMIFICQLALTPEQQSQFTLEALVQLFCCPRCHGFGEMSSGTFHVRQIKNAERDEYRELAPEHKVKRSPVFKWMANVRYDVEEFGVEQGASFVTMPDPYEIGGLLKKAKDPELKVFASEAKSYPDSDDYEEAVTAKGITIDNGKMKLGGYACWQQGEGPQPCSKCKEPMDLFLQIDGEKCWIGTDGYAVLFHCKNDSDNFALIISGT